MGQDELPEWYREIRNAPARPKLPRPIPKHSYGGESIPTSQKVRSDVWSFEWLITPKTVGLAVVVLLAGMVIASNRLSGPYPLRQL